MSCLATPCRQGKMEPSVAVTTRSPMPRIDAPTVAEHRANQERALLDAARAVLLAHGPQAVTPATVGAAAGLARSSVYKYFRSGDEILSRIVADALAEWGER